MIRRALALGFVAAAAIGAQERPQSNPSAMQRAIATGDFEGAESELYDAVRLKPRSPTSRAALGAWLAARGHLLIGATLLEEAMQFGADSASVQARLLDVHRWSGQFDKAAALARSGAPLPIAESYRRAGGLRASGKGVETVPLMPNEIAGLGRVELRLADLTLTADIQPAGVGLVLPASSEILAAVEATGSHGDTTYAVARDVKLGGFALGPVPVAVVGGVTTTHIGLDVLARFYPTFDLTARTLTLRVERSEITGEALPVVVTFPSLLVQAEHGAPPVGLHTVAGRAAVRAVRWTLDLDAGAIIVEGRK